MASEGLTIDKVHVERGEGDYKPISTGSENHRKLHCITSPAGAPAVTRAITVRMPVPSIILALEAIPGNGATCPRHSIPVNAADQGCHHAVVGDAPLVLRNALGHLIAKHPKVMSTVPTVLITVGSIVLLPGFTACATGTTFAHPAVTVSGAIAVSVGKWLRAVVHSVTVEVAAQAKPSV